MDIRTARKIAKNLGHYADSDKQRAFHRLDMSVIKDWNDADKVLMKNIWDYFGNLGVKGKA